MNIYSKSFLKFIKENAKENSKAVLIDLSCGEGHDVEFFSQNLLSFICIGVDDSSRNIALAKEKYPRRIFARQDLLELRFATNSIDYLFLANHSYYGEEQEKFLFIIADIMRVGGNAYLHLNLGVKNGRKDHLKKEKMFEDVFSLLNLKVIKKKKVKDDEKFIKSFILSK